MRNNTKKARLCAGAAAIGMLCALGCFAARGASWFALGPYGGDARSLGADPGDPKHIYLGTTTGWIYDSHDGGSNWTRLAKLGQADDLVVDHVLIDPKDPKKLVVGAFRFDQADGGIYISDNGGQSWYAQAQMRGQSVRALARSASDPNVLAAGTLQGVFVSKDNGLHWAQISPLGSTELHEVESVAIDPQDPNVVYAGTWHLPWKTNDGGEHWVNIKEGVIDDSDVFSIVVDFNNPKIVYASACSGIYKSKSAAELITDEAFCKRNGGVCRFEKVQGIPSEARRTRKLLMDPTNSKIVFAGTTEGLYRTTDAGAQWSRTTPGDVIINDVYVDPSNAQHVLLATDRGGVLSSEDGGDTFAPSNVGFSERQVLGYAADAQNPATIYVGVVNGKETGGVFQSLDGGVVWSQMSNGLAGRDVFSLATTSTGTLLAGTGHGVFRLEAGAWVDSGALADQAPPKAVAEVTERRPAPAKTVPTTGTHRPEATPATRTASRKRAPVLTKTKASSRRKPISATRDKVSSRRDRPTLRRVAVSAGKRHSAEPPQRSRPLRLPAPAAPLAAAPSAPHRVDSVVFEMLANNNGIYAATSSGLLHSDDDGHQWTPIDGLAMPEVRFIAGQKNVLLAGSLRRLAMSNDSGATWDTLPLPADLTQLSALTVDELGNLWVGGAEGVYYSTDYGLNWRTLRNLFTTEVDGIFFDAANHRVLVTTAGGNTAFSAHLPDYKVSFWETGWHLRFVRPVGDHLIGATLYDGMVLQPHMVAPTPAAQEKSAAASGPTPASSR